MIEVMTIKSNKLTPGSNMRWESNRMMLPEHREQLLQNKREKMKKKRPELEEQNIVEMEWALWEAVQEGHKVSVTAFHAYEDRVYAGCITNVDLQLQQIRLEDEEDIHWIRFQDILSVEKV